jgi:hypothetical protein
VTTKIQVTPDYFYNGAEPMSLTDYNQLNSFLNYTHYPCKVSTSQKEQKDKDI